MAWAEKETGRDRRKTVWVPHQQKLLAANLHNVDNARNAEHITHRYTD